jgi:hypothetical protein
MSRELEKTIFLEEVSWRNKKIIIINKKKKEKNHKLANSLEEITKWNL